MLLQAGRLSFLLTTFRASRPRRSGPRACDACSARGNFGWPFTPADACVFERAAKAIGRGRPLPGLASNMYTTRLLPAKTSTMKSRRNTVTWVGRRFVRVLLQRRHEIVRREHSPARYLPNERRHARSCHAYRVRRPLHGSLLRFSTRFACGFLGASDASAEVAALAHHVGFDVVAVDYDPA